MILIQVFGKTLLTAVAMKEFNVSLVFDYLSGNETELPV